ncbi:DUF1826 domain-containing protein [Celerinatantimonas sp. MCCC 1A17872]|uniref:DUF1826 domain-containing protein n=1 Tax=Celerinatantimonas sp. MCCC 1A17872 TaxID=3177514 RepID=UPI0038CA279F
MQVLDSKELALFENRAPRRAMFAHEPTVLGNIYNEECNLAVWQRDISTDVLQSISDWVASEPMIAFTQIASADNTVAKLAKAYGESRQLVAFYQHIEQLVDMFCCLFDLKEAGVRLTRMDTRMCPRFHVDRIPCRLITTFQGQGTQWLSDNEQNFSHSSQPVISQLNRTDVALVKGSGWQGNENGALIHRSPAPMGHEQRLLLTLDFT